MIAKQRVLAKTIARGIPMKSCKLTAATITAPVKQIRRSNCTDYVSKYSVKNASLEEMRDVAARICRDYLTGQWKSITAEDIVVKRISGGLSNFLYYVSLPEVESISIKNTNNITSDPTRKSTFITTNAVCDNSNNNNNITNNINNNNKTNNNTNNNNNSEDDLSPVSSHKRQRTDSGVVAAVVGSGAAQSSDEPREVLLRIYGQTHGENALESMISESVVFALLSERNFGPKLHGIFPGGRIEQFIPARPLLTSELADYKISMKIAEKLGEIHSLNLPMSKEPDWLWNCMDRWLKSLVNVLKNVSVKDNESDLEEIKSFNFCEEVKWLKSVIERGNYPVLFCHNDMQEGNILLREAGGGSSGNLRTNFEDSCTVSHEDANSSSSDNETNTLDSGLVVSGSRRKRSNPPSTPPSSPHDVHSLLDNTRDSALSDDSSSEDCEPDLFIIDFEYCAYNYRGFDLANHFLEWTFEYSNPKYPFYFHHKLQYPTQQQRQDFIATYLKKFHENDRNYAASAEEISALEQEVRIFSMFSHLFWSLWSVVNISSLIEFGYAQYALSRIREYTALKKDYLSTLK